MDDNRILTNKIFKQKINELVGADVVELDAANDDLALNCKIFEAGMDAVKTIIPEPAPTPEPGSKILVCTMTMVGEYITQGFRCDKTSSEIINAYLFGDYDYIVAKANVNGTIQYYPFVYGNSPDDLYFCGVNYNDKRVRGYDSWDFVCFTYTNNEINYSMRSDGYTRFIFYINHNLSDDSYFYDNPTPAFYALYSLLSNSAPFFPYLVTRDNSGNITSKRQLYLYDYEGTGSSAIYYFSTLPAILAADQQSAEIETFKVESGGVVTRYAKSIALT